MMGTPTSNATFGSGGQVVSGMNQDVPNGYSNYNAGYVSFKVSGWRGLTLQENLTYSKALQSGGAIWPPRVRPEGRLQYLHRL